MYILQFNTICPQFPMKTLKKIRFFYFHLRHYQIWHILKSWNQILKLFENLKSSWKNCSKMYKPVPIKCCFMTFNNDQNWAVCSPSLNAIFYQTPSQRIFILWKFIVLNVYFKGVLTMSLVLFLPFLGLRNTCVLHLYK